MKPEHIKVGQKYNFTLLATGKPENEYPATFETPTGNIVIISHDDFEAVSPINPYTPLMLEKTTVIPETYPKHDPCRKFRRGDKVRFKEHLGRKSLAHCDEIITLEADEQYGQCFWSEMTPNGDIIGRNAYFCYLELITPVEELEPYRVETGGYNRFRIKKGNLEYSYFPFGEHCVLSMDEAKAAAEAECAKLNAEYRKEKNNG